MSYRLLSKNGFTISKQMIWNDLKTKELLVLSDADLNKFLGQNFADKVRAESVTRGIKVYALNNKSIEFETNTRYIKNKHHFERIIPPEKLSLHNYLEIYNDVIAFIHWEENDLKGVEIHSKSFANTFKQIFWHYWELARK